MSLRKVYIAAAIILAVAGVGTWAWYSRQDATSWPEFAPAADQTPAVQVEIEPDFGYRTGDVVPLTVFIKQQPDTTVDITSLALEGSFEFRKEPKLTERQMPDGSKIYKIDLELQSLLVSSKLSSDLSLVWNVNGEKESRELRHKLVEVYTSMTWDGRDLIKEGPLPFNDHAALWLTVVLLGGSLAGFIWTIWYQVRADRARKEVDKHIQTSPRVLMKRKIESAWKKIASGDADPANFEAIAQAVREYFRIEAMSSRYVAIALGNHPHVNHVRRILHRCSFAVYTRARLPEPELQELKADLVDLVTGKISAGSQEKPVSRIVAVVPQPGAQPPAPGQQPGDPSGAPPGQPGG